MSPRSLWKCRKISSNLASHEAKKIIVQGNLHKDSQDLTGLGEGETPFYKAQGLRLVSPKTHTDLKKWIRISATIEGNNHFLIYNEMILRKRRPLLPAQWRGTWEEARPVLSQGMKEKSTNVEWYETLAACGGQIVKWQSPDKKLGQDVEGFICVSHKKCYSPNKKLNVDVRISQTKCTPQSHILETKCRPQIYNSEVKRGSHTHILEPKCSNPRLIRQTWITDSFLWKI